MAIQMLCGRATAPPPPCPLYSYATDFGYCTVYVSVWFSKKIVLIGIYVAVYREGNLLILVLLFVAIVFTPNNF